MKTNFIKATTLSDAWFQSLYLCVDEGNKYTVDKGSYEGQTRLGLDYITIQICYPAMLPLLPKINALLGVPDPVEEDYLDNYMQYMMTNTKKEGEEYTYGERLSNQIEMLIKTYREYGHNNNQMILQVGKPSDMILTDPPCLRHIDTKIIDGSLNFYPYFRSWDLYGGLPANLAAIELMKQYCAEQIGVKNGEIIASSKGLHLYEYAFKIAKKIRGK